MRAGLKLSGIFLVLACIPACAVGPGTPLFEAVRPNEAVKSGTVQPPKGYGPPTSTVEAQGLINKKQRKDTAAYLKSLANDDGAASVAPGEDPPNQ